MKIYFVGDLRTQFINDDNELLDEIAEVDAFDLSKHLSSHTQIVSYLLHSLLEWRSVYLSNIVWVWFADYPVIPFIVWAKLFRKPIVTFIGGWEIYSAPEINYGNQLNAIRGSLTRWIMRNSTICVVPSPAYELIAKKLEPKSIVVVIPNAVDINLCKCPLPDKRGVVTALTSMKFTRGLKGIPTFEEATVGVDARVVENVPHDELIGILKSSKVYCQLSYTESFGVTLLEAMACGCIPVVTDRDALPEVVGECGFIVPYGDVKRTREAILLALNTNTSDIETVRERTRFFSREKRKESIIKILGDLCGAH